MTLLFIFSVILLHIIDDFVLQQLGNLNNFKQKKFWEPYNKEYNNRYAVDYQMGLIIHCISWGIMVHLPLFFFGNTPEMVILISFLIHSIIHGIIDNYKCNEYKLSLVEDQILHFIQLICIIWIGVYFNV